MYNINNYNIYNIQNYIMDVLRNSISQEKEVHQKENYLMIQNNLVYIYNNSFIINIYVSSNMYTVGYLVYKHPTVYI